jgi:DNA-binding NarL/FixJ family response regulator
MMHSPVIRVAIVEDDRAARQGLAQLIGGTPGFECVGQWSSVEDALQRADAPPDVMLLDIHLPGVSGTEGVKLFHGRFPAMQIVMLTIFDDNERVFESICNGACGYLLKKTPPARLLEAIREAHQGGAPMTPEIARQVIDLFRRNTPPPQADHLLSPRELRVLALLAEGYGYTNIAAQLEITINTVRNHIRSIYEKLHVHSASEAVSKALRKRLI